MTQASEQRKQDLQVLIPLYESLRAQAESLPELGTLLTHLSQLDEKYISEEFGYEDYQDRVNSAIKAVGIGDAHSQLTLHKFKLAIEILYYSAEDKQSILATVDAVQTSQDLVVVFKKRVLLAKLIQSDAIDLAIGLCQAKLDQLFSELKDKFGVIAQQVDKANPAAIDNFLDLWSETSALLPIAIGEGGIAIFTYDLVKKIWGRLNAHPIERAAINKKFYLTDLYWTCWNNELRVANPLSSLEALVGQLLLINQEIIHAPLSLEDKVLAARFANQVINKIAALIKDKVLDANHPSLALFAPQAFTQQFPGIELPERIQALEALTSPCKKLEELSKTMFNGDEQAMTQVLTHLLQAKTDYVRGEAIGRLQAWVKLCYDRFVTYPQLLPVLDELFFEVCVLDYKPEDKQQFALITQAINEAQSPRALLQVCSDSIDAWQERVAPLSQKRFKETPDHRAKWKETIDALGERKLKKLNLDIKAKFEQLSQDLNATDANLELCAEKYLKLRPEMEVCDDIGLGPQAHFVQTLRTKLVDYPGERGEALKTFGLDTFYEDNNLASIIVGLQFGPKDISDEDLNAYAKSMFDLKKRIETANFSDEEKIHNIRYLNTIADLIIKKTVGKSLLDEEYSELNLFFTQDYPGIEIGSRVTQMVYFDSWHKALEDKWLDLVARDEQDAALAANTLITTMQDLKKQHIRGFIALQGYKDKVEAAIAIAHDELDKHRGWKQVLINLSFAVVTLGLGYLALALYRNTMFPIVVDTASKELLDELKDDVISCAV